MFVTKRGQVKRTELKDYETKRTGAVAACKLGDGDEVLSVTVSRGRQEIVLLTKQGMAIRFAESEVNAMGRVAAGVRGINLKDDDEVVAALWVEGEEGEILVVSDLGYGKRSLLLDYPLQSRGGKGVQTFEFKEGKRVKPNGSRLVGGIHCKEPATLTAVTKEGQMHNFSSEDAPLADRKSIGKALAPIDKNDEIVDFFIKE